MKETITDLLRSNTNTIVYGMSGWGKSQIIEQSSKELGMKCQILSLAGVAPEDFGIPVTREGYYEYLPPKWAVDFHKTGENFVLFLDEITQATIQVMHAIYPLVLDKRIGGLTLPNMRIIAASNHDQENPNLTTIMKPLLNRFSVELKIEEDFGQSMIDDFWSYIINKYPNQRTIIDILKSNVISTNPRAYEEGIRFLENNPSSSQVTKNFVCRKSFGVLSSAVMRGIIQKPIKNETLDQIRLRQASFSYRNKVLNIGRAIKIDPSKAQIIDAFNLTEEEQESVFI